METRLQILHDAQVIDEEIYHGMLAVVSRLEQHWQLRIRHAQGEMLITHMANALMRTRRGEIIPALDAEVLAEIAESARYPAIQTLHQDLLTPAAKCPNSPGDATAGDATCPGGRPWL